MDRQSYIDDTGASYERTLLGVIMKYDKDAAKAQLKWTKEGGEANIGKETEGMDTVQGFEAGVAATTGVFGQAIDVLGPAVGDRIRNSGSDDESASDEEADADLGEFLDLLRESLEEPQN